MPRDPFTGLLKKAFRNSVREDPELASLMEERRLSRRDFLRQTLTAGGGLALAHVLPWVPADPGLIRTKPAPPHIAIIGAGIAGLNACYQLKKLGIASTLYEASGRVGGRIFTMKDIFGRGLTTDLGGEFVDTTHTDILELVTELGLSLYRLQDDHLTPKTYYFGGRDLTQAGLHEALAPFVPRLVKDIHSLPSVISYQSAVRCEQLDSLSITDYLSAIGIQGWLYDYLNVTLTREYGMEASEQSAINFLIMFEPPAETDTDYELFGPDHEVFKIKGGSQELTDALYQRIKDQVVLEHKLVAVDRWSGTNELSAVRGQESGYSLSMEHEGSVEKIHADYVILTIPFTVFRKIPFSPPMPDGKRKCIEEMGYGNSCKFVMGMEGKPWRKAGKTGYTFTDISFGCGWDSSQLQSEEKGGFTVFGGGHFGEEMRAAGKDKLVNDYLSGLERIYPGVQQAFSGKTTKFCWDQHPFSRGGYSAFKKGQWSTLAGWEGVPVGDVYFAGEHVSREFQGYMNGGARTAREAVEQIVKKINHE
jgi:monoamine oxidase